jgi:O-antigen/teichoic acid export membrane protein
VLGRFSSIAGMSALFLSSIIKIMLVFFQASLIWFAVETVLATGILALILLLCYSKQKLSILRWRFEWSIAKALLQDSWPLIFSGLALMVQARIDQVMLKNMIGTEEVGYYSVASRLIEAFAFIPMMLSYLFTPTMIRAKAKSELLYQDRLGDYYKISFLLFLIIGLPLFILSEKIVVLLFGVDYQPAGILLALMSIRLFFTNIGVARSVFILTENLFKYSLMTMVIGTIVNVVLNYILIPDYQSRGAIIATIASFFVTIFLVDFFYIKTHKNTLLIMKSIFTSYKINFNLNGK